ncbi:MAG: RNA recognition motif domain-containing protein [Nanobdellota archaeon]
MKLFVGNLPWSVRDEKLREVFSEFGEVSEAKVIMDRRTDRSKGFGFVEFANDEEAKNAMEGMNGKELEGRPLTVNEAKPKAE